MFSRRRALKGACALLASIPIAGCPGNSVQGASNGDGDPTVKLSDDQNFSPKEITVSTGSTVTWKNTGSMGHTVTAYEDSLPDGAEYFASGDFDSEKAARNAYAPYDSESGYIPGGESYEHTFETAGTYKYFCIPHESTGKGTVVVEE